MLENMFSAIGDMLSDFEYNGAIEDLNNNVRAKADDSVDGSSNNDWIIDPDEQVEVCWKIDALVAYLETLSELHFIIFQRLAYAK